MAATETITLNLQGNAFTQLQKLETQVGKLGQRFLGLRNVLSGIAITSIISNTLKWADSIDDLSKATGIATNNVLGFSQALQLNGGDAEKAQAAMNKFVLSIDEAATGSAKTQQAFKDIGVSLSDLSKLSEQQLFDTAIQGLSTITDKSKQAAIANELFGKSIRGVDFSKVAEDYYTAALANKKYTDAIKKGADTQENIEMAVTNLKLALLEMLTPLSDLAKGINNNIDSIKKWADIIWAVIKPIVLLFGAFKVLKYAGPILLELISYITSMGEVIIALTRNTWNFLKLLATPLTRSNFFKTLQELGGMGSKIRAVWAAITDGIEGAALKAGTFLAGLLGIADAYKTIQKYQPDFSKPLKIEGGAAQAMPEDFFSKGREQRRQVEDANKKLNNSILDIRQNYDKARKSTEEALAAEVAYAMMSGDLADQIKAQRQAYDTVINAVDELKKKREDLTADQEDQKKLIDSEIKKLLETIPAATESARARVAALQDVRNAQDAVLKQTELMKNQLTDDANIKAIQDQIALIQLYGDELENANIALEVTQSLEQQLLTLRQQELDLIAKKGQLTDEQFRKEMDQIEALRIAAYNKAGAELDAKNQVKQAQRAADDNAILGIQKYFDELERGATPAKVAVEQVKSVFDNMNGALDSFIRTGKFKFKEFAASIIQDLLAIYAKEQLLTIFKAATGSGGIIGSIFSALTGKATGGPVQGKTPYMVGENGPELFVPQGAGKIVPNNQLGSQKATVVNNTYYNVNAVDAKSVAQLFAENRKALLGASRMAEKEMPYMGR